MAKLLTLENVNDYYADENEKGKRESTQYRVGIFNVLFESDAPAIVLDNDDMSRETAKKRGETESSPATVSQILTRYRAVIRANKWEKQVEAIEVHHPMHTVKLSKLSAKK